MNIVESLKSKIVELETQKKAAEEILLAKPTKQEVAIIDIINRFNDAIAHIDMNNVKYSRVDGGYEVVITNTMGIDNRFSVLHSSISDIKFSDYIEKYAPNLDFNLPDGGEFLVRYAYDGGGIDSWNVIVLFIAD